MDMERRLLLSRTRFRNSAPLRMLSFSGPSGIFSACFICLWAMESTALNRMRPIKVCRRSEKRDSAVIGYFGGRSFVEKYGKYFLVSKKDLEDADRWVDKYGDWSFFICRMLPVVRTFISLPAGILRAKKRFFFTFTFLGSLVWSYLLIYVGVKMGQNMEAFKHIWHKFDILIITVFLVLGCLYVYKHFKHLKES